MKTELLKELDALGIHLQRAKEEIENRFSDTELSTQLENLRQQVRIIRLEWDRLADQIDPLQMLTLEDVCNKLICSRQTITPYILSGVLKACRTGKGYAIARRDLEDFQDRIYGLDLRDHDHTIPVLKRDRTVRSFK